MTVRNKKGNRNGLIISKESKLKSENKKLKLRIEALEEQLTLTDVGCSNNIDYKQAFELALKYINSKPLKVDKTIEELTAWDNLTDFIDEHKLY